MNALKLPEITPERIMRTATGVIVCVAVLSGVLFYCGEINALHYLPGIVLCPFHLITGMDCPGCGMTRALLTLGQLNVKQAIALNPFSLPLFSVMLLYLWLGYIPRFLQQKVFLRLSIPAVVTLWICHLVAK
jgi:hypothetical protein